MAVSTRPEKTVEMINIWLCICMFFSGFSALVYEIAWLRLMSLTLGNTAYATSCTLAIFLLGLALGAYLGGRLADRLKLRPLHSYALVELGIGLTAATISPILVAVPATIFSFKINGPLTALDPIIIMAIFSCILLLLPTILMGATLPFILKQIGEYAPPQKSFGHIYGLNTLGAVFGSLSAAFVGFGYLGIYGTILAAVLVNCIIGLISFVVSARLPAAVTQAQVSASTYSNMDISKPDGPAQVPFPLGLVCLLAFSSGYSSLTFEVVWVRILRFFNSSLTYTFTVMISTFLLGLALGSLIYEKFIENKDRTVHDKLFRFANLQYLSSLASGAYLAGLALCFVLNYYLRSSGIFTDPTVNFFLILLLDSAIFILVPATLIGMLFPILGTIAASSGQTRLGSGIGIVYAVNTLGCVLGSIISGLILIPRIGSYDTFQLAILLGVLCAGVAIWKNPNLRRNKKLVITFLPIVAALSFYLFVKVPFHNLLQEACKNQILFYGEDAMGTVLVHQFTDYDGRGLIVNGDTFATTVQSARRYMRMLGHLPVLLHPNPKRVMIACFGTGTTAGAASVHPEVDHLDIVELSKLIIKAGPLFSRYNHNVLRNPKTTVHIGDARHFLLSHKEKFDVISMEPPPPTSAGVVNLYTTEFNKLVSARLNDNGIFAQWVPLHGSPGVLWRMMLQSAGRVFPYTSIWSPSSSEAILIASKSPLQFDAGMIRKRILESKAVRASLKDVGIDDMESVLSTYVMSDRHLRSFVDGVSEITDDRPALEFFLPYRGRNLNNRDLLKYGDPGIPDTVSRPADVDLNAFKRHKQALILALTIDPALAKEKQAKIFDQIDQLEPDNNYYRFLRKWMRAN